MNVLGDTVTVYNRLGEDSEGRASWQRTVITNVALFRYGGVQQYPARTLEGNDTAALYIFAGRSKAERDFAPEGEFAKALNPSLFYTLHEDGSDRIVAGICTDASPPDGPGTYRPIGIQYGDRGNQRMRHIKAICK